MPFLTWINDKDARSQSKNVPFHILKSAGTYGDPSAENLIVHGDNLLALRALLPFYRGKVKCIYIDPPYNTGSAFEHYDDNLEHSQWLSMMYPRLQLLREFLSEDGSIWIQIDDYECAYLTVMMDEIFGRRNFITSISVKMSHLSGVKMSHVNKTIPKLKETVLLYAKSKDSFSLKPCHVLCDWDTAFPRYTSFVQRNPLALNDCSQWNVITVKEAARQAGIDVNDKEAYEDFRLKNASNIFRTARNNSDIFKTLPVDDLFHLVETASGMKKFAYKREEVLFCSERLKEINGKKAPAQILGDIWSDIAINNLHNEGGVDFKNGKKPEKLIERVLSYVTEENDLVLDAFLGSGSTAAVAHKMGRRYIGIEMGEHAKTHCIPRLQKVIDGEQGGISASVNWQGGGGFRFFELGEPAFDKWGCINPEVDFKTLAAFVWMSETGEAAQPAETPFLGVSNGTAYYLLYAPEGATSDPSAGVLTFASMQQLLKDHPFDGPKVVFAEACAGIAEQELKAHQITFKQIPTDLLR